MAWVYSNKKLPENLIENEINIVNQLVKKYDLLN